MGFKNLFKKIILLFFVVGLYFIAPIYMQYATPLVPIICAIICIAVVSYYVYYVKKVKKTSLFLFALFAFFAFSSPVIADEKSDIALASGFVPEVCSAVGSENYTTDIRKKADKIIDVYSKYGSSALSSGHQCAEEYVKKISELQKTENKSCSLMSIALQAILEKDDCWPCDITSLIIDAMQKMAIASHDVVNSAALTLLAVLYMGWLIISTMMFFGKFGFSKMSEYFSNLLSQTLMTLVVFTILSSPLVNVYSLIVSPAVQYGAGLSIEFAEIGEKAINDNKNIVTSLSKVLSLGSSQKCSYCDKMTQSDNLSAGEFMDSGSINGMLCMICTVYRSVAPMITMGQSMICMANSNTPTLNKLPGVSSVSLFFSGNMSLLMVGYIMTVTASMLMFIIGFYIISIMMKLGLVLMLLPIVITCYTFKFSRVYAVNMWKLILHSVGTLIALSIATAMIMIGFNSLLPDSAMAIFSQMFDDNNAGTLAATFSGQETGGEGGQISFSCLLLTAFAFMSISIIDSTSRFVERVTGVWLNLSDVGSAGLMAGGMTALKTGATVAKGTASGTIAVGTIMKNGVGGVMGDTFSSSKSKYDAYETAVAKNKQHPQAPKEPQSSMTDADKAKS